MEKGVEIRQYLGALGTFALAADAENFTDSEGKCPAFK